MANPIKYSLSPQTLSLRKGNFWIGTGDVDKGPSVTSGYYAGITPPSGGYTIYLSNPGGNYNIVCPPDDSKLLAYCSGELGLNFSSVGGSTGALAWFASQTNKMIFNEDYPAIVTNGLILNMDAGFTPSYPRGGTSWYDIGPSGNNGALLNGPTYADNSIVFDGVDDYVLTNTLVNPLLSTGFTFSCTLNYIRTSANDNIISWGNNAFNTGTGYSFEGRFRIFGGNSYSLEAAVSSGQTGAPVRAQIFNGSNDFTGRTYALDFVYSAGSSLAIFVNGVAGATASYAGISPFAFTQAVRVARGTDTYLKGSYYTVRGYQRPLSQAEILQNYYQANIVTSDLFFSIDASNVVSYGGTGATAYDLTRGATGILYNGVGFSSGLGGYWTMDGADDFIRASTVGNTSFPQSTGSFMFWYYVSSIGGNTDFKDQSIFDGYDTGGRNHFFVRNYYVQPNNIQIVVQTSNAGSYLFAHNNYLPNDVWHHVCVTYRTGSNSSIQVYLDGIQTVSSTIGANPSTWVPDGQFVGFGASGSGCMKGRYAYLSIYNTQLTASQVQQNYNAQKSRFGL